MVLGGEVFGSGLGHQGRAFMNAISVLQKEAPEGIPCPFYHVRAQQESASYEPRRGRYPKYHAGTFSLTFQSPKL